MHDTSNKNASPLFAISKMCFFPQLQAKIDCQMCGCWINECSPKNVGSKLEIFVYIIKGLFCLSSKRKTLYATTIVAFEKLISLCSLVQRISPSPPLTTTNQACCGWLLQGSLITIFQAFNWNLWFYNNAQGTKGIEPNCPWKQKLICKFPHAMHRYVL